MTLEEGPQDQEESRALERVLDAASSLTGTTGGAAVGLLIGGPAGVVLGAGAGWAIMELAKIGSDVAQRILSPRAETRIGATLILATEEIRARVMGGETPREDLLNPTVYGQTEAGELIEGTLLKAAQTHEERKIAYIAHLLAGIFFEPDLTQAHANQLIALADALSYRQLVILAVYASNETPTNQIEYVGEDKHYPDEAKSRAADDTYLSVRIDMLELFRRGMFRVAQRRRTGRKPYEMIESGATTPLDELPWPAIPEEVSPIETYASHSGLRLARLMRLDEVPEEDRETLVLQYVRLRPQS